MNQLNPYRTSATESQPADAKSVVHATRFSAFRAGALRGAKLALVITYLGLTIVFVVLLLDPIVRHSVVDGFRRDPVGELLGYGLLSVMAGLLASFVGGFAMGRVEARRWRPPDA